METVKTILKVLSGIALILALVAGLGLLGIMAYDGVLHLTRTPTPEPSINTAAIFTVKNPPCYAILEWNPDNGDCPSVYEIPDRPMQDDMYIITSTDPLSVTKQTLLYGPLIIRRIDALRAFPACVQDLNGEWVRFTPSLPGEPVGMVHYTVSDRNECE